MKKIFIFIFLFFNSFVASNAENVDLDSKVNAIINLESDFTKSHTTFPRIAIYKKLLETCPNVYDVVKHTIFIDILSYYNNRFKFSTFPFNNSELYLVSFEFNVEYFQTDNNPFYFGKFKERLSELPRHRYILEFIVSPDKPEFMAMFSGVEQWLCGVNVKNKFGWYVYHLPFDTDKDGNTRPFLFEEDPRETDKFRFDFSHWNPRKP